MFAFICYLLDSDDALACYMGDFLFLMYVEEQSCQPLTSSQHEHHIK